MAFFILALVATLTYFAYSYFKRRMFMRFSKLQNGPKPYPIIGNINVLFKQNILVGLSQLKQAYSLPCNFWIWDDYYYLTDCPHEVKAVLSNTNKSFQKAPFYNDLIKVMLADTFIMAGANDVANWRYERKIVARAFAPSMWSIYVPVFHKKASILLENLRQIDNFESLLSALNRNTFEIFMENFMGIDIKSPQDENELYTLLAQLTVRLSSRSLLNRLLPHWFFKHLTEEGRHFYRIVNYTERRIKYLINQKRRELLEENSAGCKQELAEDANKLKLVESLLIRNEDFLIDDIYRQIILIYFTSIDTSALTLAYTLIQLGMHSEIQDKVYEEIKNFVDEGEDIVTEDLSKLKYLEQCILEAIRLYTIVPITGRHATEDINLGDRILPKGANVIISPYLIHRNEKYWADSETFDPSRFSAENAKSIVPGSFVPFLIGPRDCPGRYYSIAQVKITAANILKKFMVKVNPRVARDIKFGHFIVIKPEINFGIEFIPRI